MRQISSDSMSSINSLSSACSVASQQSAATDGEMGKNGKNKKDKKKGWVRCSVYVRIFLLLSSDFVNRNWAEEQDVALW